MVMQILGLHGREGTHQAGLGCIPHPAPSCSLPLRSLSQGGIPWWDQREEPTEHWGRAPSPGGMRSAPGDLAQGLLGGGGGGVSQAPPSSGGPFKDGDTSRHVT